MPVPIVGQGATAKAASIVSFTLVNADTELDLFDLTPGIILNLATLPTRNLNIRANTDLAPVGSITFLLSGSQGLVSTDDVAPFALFGDLLGNYNPWTPPLGSYTLLATPYDGPNGTGSEGAPLTLSFSVISSVGAVTGFTLVNADTGLDIIPLTTGAVLNLTGLPTLNLNIRADASPPTVGSVEFRLSGTQSKVGTENAPPYALFGYVAGNYSSWTPPVGPYSLTATAYAGPNATGAVGSASTISFSVVAAPLPVELTAFSAEARGPLVQLRWTTASETNNQEFVVERSLDGEFFAARGRVAGNGTTAVAHAYAYDDQLLPPDPNKLYYRLRQVDFNGKVSFSPVRVVAVPPPAAGLQVYLATVPDGVLRYSFTGPPAASPAMLELFNMAGQRLQQSALATDGAGTLPVAGLPTGIYILRLTSGRSRFGRRFALP